MRIRLLTLLITVIFGTSACSQTLTQGVYRHAKGDSSNESATAFVTLSNLALSPELLARLEQDYRNVDTDPARFYYEFVLAKRTQQPSYVSAFIESAGDNLPALIENRTRWVSITSPFYELLAMYSRTDDKALAVMFELASTGDGAGLSAVSQDLAQIYRQQPQRFRRVVREQNVPLNQILQLFSGHQGVRGASGK